MRGFVDAWPPDEWQLVHRRSKTGITSLVKLGGVAGQSLGLSLGQAPAAASPLPSLHAIIPAASAVVME